MSINLKKGASFNLTKNEPGLKKVMIGLGWEPASAGLDLDASVFINGSNGRLLSESHFVFYNNLKSPDGAIVHTGDNRTGHGDDDDEIIGANLDMIDANATEIVVIVSIHEATARRHRFGMLKDAYIRLFDVESKREVLRYDLDAEFGDCTEVIFGKIEKRGSEWFFVASGIGSSVGLQGIIDKYIPL
jgi:tellurium resistance protein TerD